MIEFLAHPLYMLIIAFFITILVIFLSMFRGALLKKTLGMTFLNITLWVVLIFFFTNILDHEDWSIVYLALSIVNFVVFIVMLYIVMTQAIFRTNHYHLFIKAVKNSSWNTFYVVDQNDRIKDISQSLLLELNLEKDEVIGKKWFDIFNKAVRFTKLNDQFIDNNYLETYYQNLKKNIKPDDQVVEELMFNNASGDQVLVRFQTQGVFVMGKYRGRICVGEKKSNMDLLEVEKALQKTDNQLESIKHKFIAILELSDEGLFQVSLDHNFIWLSDALVNQLSLSSNQMSLDQYRSLMHPDDLNKYLTNLGMLTAAKANYTITYRINLNGKEVWVKEKGKRLFEDSDSQSIIGVISVSSTTNFSKTNLAEIDNTQDEDHLLTDLNNLIKTGRIFQFAIINLYNVVEINQKYGRKVGNMIMNQYIAQLRQTLMSESSQIYRLSGLEFAFTITDERKMGTLRQFINTNTQFFNLTMTYGSLEVELKAKIGISTLSEDAHNANELYQNAYRALKTVMLPNYNGSGAYYKDIQS